jgi:FkbM family methyltransferase
MCHRGLVCTSGKSVEAYAAIDINSQRVGTLRPLRRMEFTRHLIAEAARRTPLSIKTLVHNNLFLDRLSRRVFRMFLGRGAIRIESGPMAGLSLAVSEHISHAHIRGIYEIETQQAVMKHLRPGFVCYDLGASIGYLSLLMASAKAAHVYCFEPAPHAAREIHKHMDVNGFKNYSVIPDPVSNTKRLVRFALTEVTYGSGIVDTDTRWPVIELTSVTLDEFAASHEFPDFIKIDVEGEEDRVLEGARTILEKRRTLICCEVHTNEDAEQVSSLLGEYGYRITTLDGKPFRISGEIRSGEVQVLAYPPAN